MLRNLVAAWSIPDVRSRILYVFGMIAVFVVGLHIPVPGVNLHALEQLIRNNSMLGLFDVFRGAPSGASRSSPSGSRRTSTRPSSCSS